MTKNCESAKMNVSSIVRGKEIKGELKIKRSEKEKKKPQKNKNIGLKPEQPEQP
jgi:hypothetical protein